VAGGEVVEIGLNFNYITAKAPPDRDMNERVTPEYLSLAELAIYASVAKNTLKKWLKDGMPHYKVNRCIRVRIDEFNTWMHRFRVGTSPSLDAMLDQVMKEARQ
jgi:excisionase family DNA binding protein